MNEPFVTVIMPIRNEAQFIAHSLGAVLAQDYPQDKLEVLVADGMSDDGTLEIIRTLPGSERVRIILNPQRNQAEGLNKAIKQASGEIIVRVDGHTIIAPDYVRRCVQNLQNTGAANVGGTMNPVGITPMGKAIAAAGKSPFAVPSAFHVSDKAQFTDTVYLGAWHREVFDRIGMFNGTVVANQDYEFNYRIRKAGGQIYLDPQIKSQYFCRQNLLSLAQQYFRYGVGKVQVLRLHPESIRWRQLAAPAFVAGLVIGAILAPIHRLIRICWLIGIAVYTLLTLIFTLKTAQRFGLNLILRLPLVFPTIHISWGVGFWIGIMRILREKCGGL